MTASDFKCEAESQEQIEDEIRELQHVVLQHIQVWTELETALSALLYTALNIQPASSKIAYAIYHGLTGFDARLTVVSNVIIQIMDENIDLEMLRKHWEKLAEKIKSAKNTRNTIAHGTIQTLICGTDARKKRAVLSPLPFDVIKLDRVIKEGRDPGLSVSQLRQRITQAIKLSECLDSVNHVILNFHKFGKETLDQTIPATEACLNEFSSLKFSA